jgi:hypothetical protein
VGGTNVASFWPECQQWGWQRHICPGHRLALTSPPRAPLSLSLQPEGHLNLTAPCNAACDCRPEHYSPVCGSDGTMYYSPCHAGCPAATGRGPGGQKVSVVSHPRPGWDPPRPPLREALCSSCDQRCVGLPRCTETVAVSLRMFPLVWAMLPQGNAPQPVRESPSFWFSCSL